MARKRYKEEQIIGVLQEAEGGTNLAGRDALRKRLEAQT
jgi:hypothetical protein